MSALPTRTNMSDPAPAPNNATARAWHLSIYDYLSGLFGATGTPAAARTALGSTTVGDAVFVAANAAAARTTIDTYSKSETDTKLDNPAFSAYINANQTITSSIYTKVNFDTEEFDIGSCYDTTLKRWTPNKPGYYYAGGFFNNFTSTGLTLSIASIYKNGSLLKQVADIRGSVTGVSSGGCLVYCNGTTDYVEFYGYITATTATISGGANVSGFYGYFVRS